MRGTPESDDKSLWDYHYERIFYSGLNIAKIGPDCLEIMKIICGLHDASKPALLKELITVSSTL